MRSDISCNYGPTKEDPIIFDFFEKIGLGTVIG